MTQNVIAGAPEDIAAGTMRLIESGDLEILLANCDGILYAIENRCSHDDGPLDEGTLDARACTVECPRHGSVFDLRSGRPLCLPAYEPVETYPVVIEDGEVRIAVE